MRVLGWLAMALGLVGIVIGIALALGVWVIKPNIQARTQELVAAADSGLERAGALTDAVAVKLVELSNRVQDVKAKADALAAAPVFDGTLATALGTAISDFVSGPYANLRADYAALKERVTNAGESLKALDDAFPAVTLPGTAMERLQEMDAQLVQIDSQVSAIAQSVAEGYDGPGIAARVSERVTQVLDFLVSVGEKLTEVEARLQQTRDRLVTTNENIATALTLSAGATTLFGLYFAGLNLLLVRQGREWSRRKPAPTTS
jgi:hypothetical protein